MRTLYDELSHPFPMPLTYCLNIHRGESWKENFDAIRTSVIRVRNLVSPGKPFGLGMRLSGAAAETLSAPESLEEFRDFLRAEDLFVFTMNGFPYGRFHATVVKQNVYAPDWRSAERRDYTNRLASILAGLIGEQETATISSVPGSWKEWLKTPADLDAMIVNLMECVAFCATLAERTGRDIVLTLEPEPGCFLETTVETVAFFKDHLFTRGAHLLREKLSCTICKAEELIRHHLGVCLDTCHVALQFEDPMQSLRTYESEGIRVPKVQISSALRTGITPESIRALGEFVEPVYLHQVKGRTESGAIVGWNDLPEALESLPGSTVREARVHFHVPLHFTQSGELGSTAELMTPEFLTCIGSRDNLHLEIETYTWDVLPPALRSSTVEESIAREFAWVRERMRLVDSNPAER